MLTKELKEDLDPVLMHTPEEKPATKHLSTP